MNAWYSELTPPPLTPPSWVFAPAWSVLYTMIALSIILYVKRRFCDRPYAVFALIGIHLLSNFIWTPLFFRAQSPGWALVDIIFLDLTLIAIVWVFWKQHRPSSILLWPYLGWVCFATYLNIGFYLLN